MYARDARERVDEHDGFVGVESRRRREHLVRRGDSLVARQPRAQTSLGGVRRHARDRRPDGDVFGTRNGDVFGTRNGDVFGIRNGDVFGIRIVTFERVVVRGSKRRANRRSVSGVFARVRIASRS